MILSLDCETTGVDLRHGAMPFFVSMCDENGINYYWDWPVDPMTRKVVIPKEDITSIRKKVDEAEELILQNSKFDAEVLEIAGIIPKFPWHKTNDTLIAGHMLASNHRHNLTDMIAEYIGVDIEPMELAVKDACTRARRLARTKKFKFDFGEYRIAKKDEEDMPSAKDETWKFDMWLPKVMAKILKYPVHYLKDGTIDRDLSHEWWYVTEDYANTDTVGTYQLWQAQKKEIDRRQLWAIYKETIKVLPIAVEIQKHGITISKQRKDEKYIEYEEEAERNHRICSNLAGVQQEELKLNGQSNMLKEIIFDKFQLISNKKTKKGNDSMDKTVLEHWLATLPTESKSYHFVKHLLSYRKRRTAMSYMEGYERFWVSLGIPDWFRLHPSLNPTGTHTLRWSSNNPNEQNISKKEGFNLRYCFGPAPGREWWSCDAQNIELRLPAYESDETEMIQLFERPNDPPYFGSNHLLISHILWPKEFEKCINDKGELDGRIFKKKYADTLYQWTKNGNFAVQYGAVVASGTADRAYHQSGAQLKVMRRFKKIAELNQWCIDYAKKYGYIETIPDKTVDPDRGYPLLCTRTNYGKILETVPLNYRIQGTACWWMRKAKVRVHEQLQKWNAKGFDGHIVMQVHDEMVFDFPKYGDPKANPKASNLWRIREIQRIMAMSGDDIGIPTPVSAEYHPDNWSTGITF